MNDCDLVQKLEIIMAENERLKNRNNELIEKLKIQETWSGIREGIIIPKLKEKYGRGDTLFSTIASKIGELVKEYLRVNRFTEINETNYEAAKEISIALIETFCKYEWPHLRSMQKEWGKRDIRIAMYR